MYKVIQIRGFNGSGKSTAVREFIGLQKSVPDVQEIKLKSGDKKKVTLFGNGIAILGEYADRDCACGCDVYGNRENVADAIEMLMLMKFETIIFEGLIYGKTFKFGEDISKLSKNYGYIYIPVLLDRDFDECVEHVTIRNGGNPKKLPNKLMDWISFRTSYERLVRSGIKGIRLDPTGKERGWLGESINEIAAREN